MNIVLTGLMGTGKTAVGALLAQHLGWRFLDIDHEIEREAGIPVAEIFAMRGEAFFRSLERAAVRQAGARDATVIACGGGVVLNADNMDDLERNGIIVCLTAQPEVIAERLRGDGTRPLVAGEDRLEKIRELQRVRESCYRRCRCMVDTTGQSVPQIVQAILVEPCIAAIRGS